MSTTINIVRGTAVRGWYTCTNTGKKFRGAEAEEQFAIQDAAAAQLTEPTPTSKRKTRKGINPNTKALAHVVNVIDNTEGLEITLSSGQITTGPVVEISCTECGTIRLIKPQDAFQVRRCLECQGKYRKMLRANKRKAKSQSRKASQQ